MIVRLMRKLLKNKIKIYASTYKNVIELSCEVKDEEDIFAVSRGNNSANNNIKRTSITSYNVFP